MTRFQLLDAKQLAKLDPEFEAPRSDYRLYLVEFAAGKYVRTVGCDGGEPEDNTFGRDWSWVPDELNKLAEEKAGNGGTMTTILQHRDGRTIEIKSLTADDAKLIPLPAGWAFGTIEPVPTFKPLGAPEKPAAKAPRDTAARDAATERVRLLIAGNATVFTAKYLAGHGITGPQFSAAKKALIKAGVAVDPGKGKIGGKAASAS